MKKQIFILFLGLFWITVNTFLLPFFPWSHGITRAWLLINGYLPYRDLTWLRTPLDIFLLAFWMRIFGVSDLSYQFFIFLILILTAIFIYWVGNKISPKVGLLSLIFYTVFLFPLFQNAEIGETLIAMYVPIIAGTLFAYFETGSKKMLFIAGLFCGISLITKQNSFFIIPATLISFILFLYKEKKIFSQELSSLLVLVFGFAAPVLALVIFYAYNNALSDLIYYTIGVVLGDYRREALPVGIAVGEGMWVEASFIVLFIPFLIFWKKTKLSTTKIFSLSILFVSLFPSLFPSYLSYRAITMFPLVSFVGGYNLSFIFEKGRGLKLQKLIVIISIFLFLILNMRFIKPYYDSIVNDGIGFNQIIKDYGEAEYKTAEWIQKYTKENEKITALSHPVIYLLSDRFPKNKYIDANPNMLYPFDKTSKIFLKDPPRIVVFEENLTEQFPHYVKWPFYQYFRKNYILQDKFGQLSIYERPFSAP